MRKSLILTGASIIILSSCVSSKKYTTLEKNLTNTKAKLNYSNTKNKQLEKKVSNIKERIDQYNRKLFSLANENNSLSIANTSKVNSFSNGLPLTKNGVNNLNKTLAKMDPNIVAGAKTLKDSINLALNYNLTNSGEFTGDLNINVAETVVKINVSDKLLFQTGSFSVNPKAYNLLGKLAEIIKTEPSIDVMVEGHTDSRPINTSGISDNWDLSVKRSTSIIRILQNKYNVNPSQLIASGRSSYMPLVDNNNVNNRALNRRTQIII